MSVTIESLSPNDKINFNTRTNIRGRTVWTGCTYLGHVPADVARNIDDIAGIVASTAAHFPTGSPTNPEQITYMLCRSELISGVSVIPLPLIEKSTLELVSNQILQVTVHDTISVEQLRSILAGNGLKDFSINATRTGA